MKLLLIFSICFLFSVVIAQNGESCITPEQLNGECIVLRSCASIFQKMVTRSLTPEDKMYIRNSHCGFLGTTPLVCCPLVSSTVSPSSSNDLLPLPGTCGVSSTGRIIGGNITKIDEFPWMVLLEYSKPGNLKGFHCGGSLINNQYVLTASHCVNGKDIPRRWNLVSVRLGEWNTTSDADCDPDDHSDCSDDPIDLLIAEKITHPQFVPRSTNQMHDIALLRLERSVYYTDFIKPICLPQTNHWRSTDYEQFTFTAAGWGRTESVSASNVKLKVEMGWVRLDQCQTKYTDRSITLVDSQLCAGGVKGFDSCRGDSGGPLMIMDTTNSGAYWHLVGIVSFGPLPCGQQGWPGVYTKITPYVDWIRRTIRP